MAANFIERNVGQRLSLEKIWAPFFNIAFNVYLSHYASNAPAVIWKLLPRDRIPNCSKWRKVTLQAKVRFICKVCSRSWTTKRGNAEFWWTMAPQGCEGRQNEGLVAFRLAGQQCLNCVATRLNGKLSTDRCVEQPALWYDDQVVETIWKLMALVAEDYGIRGHVPTLTEYCQMYRVNFKSRQQVMKRSDESYHKPADVGNSEQQKNGW